MSKPNFWIQPCEAFDVRSRGRTEAELLAHEARIGFRLPHEYRELLRLQNGGEIRWSELPGSGVSVSHFSEIGVPGHLVNFREYMLATASDEELADCAREHAPLHPERLVLFSGLDGHSCAYFDYGYRQAEPRTEPEVVFLGDDAGDLLGHGEIGPRLPSFAALLEALQPGGDFAERTFLGIVSPEPYSKLVATMQHALGTSFEPRTDDRYGHFDFDLWHAGSVPLELDDETLRRQAERTGTTFEELHAWAEQGRSHASAVRTLLAESAAQRHVPVPGRTGAVPRDRDRRRVVRSWAADGAADRTIASGARSDRSPVAEPPLTGQPPLRISSRRRGRCWC